MLFELYLSFFKIGAFTFGGGLSALPLLQEVALERNNWLSLQDFSNLITLSEITPGPIAINAATFVGFKTESLAGAISATLGIISPSIVVVGILAYIYNKYHDLGIIKNVMGLLKYAVVALIMTAGINIAKSALFAENKVSAENFRYPSLIVMLILVFLLQKKKISPIPAILVSGLLMFVL